MSIYLDIVQIVFWASGLLVVYIYAGYPLSIYLLSKVCDGSREDLSYVPSVSILISAFNEEKDIVRTLENKLQLDYPQDKLEIIVVSDESTDNTDFFIKQLAERSNGRISLFRQSPRQGKTSALNLAVPHAKDAWAGA